ncbi:MAG: hypothetical protein V3V78_02895, partial [Candidatus Woesearchaeota archaeon]
DGRTTSSGGGSRRGTSIACDPTWECTDWSSCINGQYTRTCTDKWNCGDTSGKPSETITCIIPEPEPESTLPPVEEVPLVFEEAKPKGTALIYIIISVVALGLAVGAGFVFYERERAHTALQHEKSQPVIKDESLIKLQSYVNQMLEQRYSRVQIREALIKEGWKLRVVNQVMKGG